MRSERQALWPTEGVWCFSHFSCWLWACSGREAYVVSLVTQRPYCMHTTLSLVPPPWLHGPLALLGICQTLFCLSYLISLEKKKKPNTISPLNDVAPSFISFGFLLKAISLYSWSNNASFPHPPSCFLVNPQGCTIPFFCFVFPLEYLWWPDFYYYFLLFNVLSAPLECKCHMRTWILSALYIIVSSVPRTLSRT